MNKLAIFAFAALFAMTMAAAPQVTDSKWMHAEFDVDDTKFKVITHTITFDQDLYVNGKRIGSIGPYRERWTAFKDAGLKLKCGNFEVAANDTQIQGPPPYLMGFGATPEALSTFLAQVFGAYNSDSKLQANGKQLAMGYILTGVGKLPITSPLTKAAIDGCKGGQIMWNNLKNQGGEAVAVNSVTVNKPAYHPPCTEQGMIDTGKAMRNMFKLFVGLDDPNQLGNFLKGPSAITARNAYLGCIHVAGPFFNAETTIGGTVTSTVCTETNKTSPAYLNDPCCNHALRWNQCCKPRQTQQLYKILGSVKPAVVQNACNHPKEITQMLRAFRRAHNNNQKPTGKCMAKFLRDFSSTQFADRSKFKSDCQTELFTSRTCVADSDCNKYGPLSCVEEGWNTKNFKCEQPWANPDPFLLTCYIKKMDNRTNAFNRADWGLRPDTTKDAYEKEFRRRMTSVDCYGPDTDPRCVITNVQSQGACNGNNVWWDSQNQWCIDGSNSHQPSKCKALANRRMVVRRSFTTWEKNEATGNHEPKFYPANKTQCLLRKVCSYNLWEPGMTKSSCENKAGPSEQTPNGPRKFFCGICWGPYCADVSIPSICYNQNAKTQQQCSALGAGWSFVKNQWNQNVCVKNGVTTQAACLPTSICPAGGPSKDQVWGDSQWRCGQALCHTNAANAQACYGSGQGYYWNSRMKNGQGLCIHWASQNNASCVNAGHMWWPGRSFQNGLLDTREKCAKGICSFDSSLNKQDCESRQYCTQRCQICQSNRYEQDKKVLCRNTTANTANKCKQAGGVWDATDSICAMTSIYKTRQTCQAQANHVWYSCGQYNKDQCSSASGPGRFMQCQWQKWGNCPDAQSCQKTGVCNDYGMRGGACVVEFENNNGHPKCPQGTSNLDRNYCKDTTKNEAQCKAAGSKYRWVAGQARNKTECMAYGKACFDQWGNKLGHPDARKCLACGNTWRSKYEWTAGVYGAGFMKNGTWRAREYRTFNSWGPTMNRSRVDKMANKAILSDMGQVATGFFRCLYNPIFFALRKVACDCGSQRGSNCFSKNVNIEDLKVAEELFIPGKALSLGNEVGTVTLPASASDNYVTVSVAVVPSEVFANPNATTQGSNSVVNALMSVFAPRSVGNSAEYAVIKNANGATVGQLVSSGINVAGNANFQNPVTVCVTPNSDIDIDATTYPTKDFVKGDTNSQPGVPLSKSVAVTNGQYCFDTTEPGTYYAINRLTNFANATPTPTPTASASATPTPTPSSTTTTSDASTTRGSFIAIVVAIVVALLM